MIKIKVLNQDVTIVKANDKDLMSDPLFSKVK